MAEELAKRFRYTKKKPVIDAPQYDETDKNILLFELHSRVADREEDRFNEPNEFSLGISIQNPTDKILHLFPSEALLNTGYEMPMSTFIPSSDREVTVLLKKTKDGSDLDLPFCRAIRGVLLSTQIHNIHQDNTGSLMAPEIKPQAQTDNRNQKFYYF